VGADHLNGFVNRNDAPPISVKRLQVFKPGHLAEVVAANLFISGGQRSSHGW
jgi:hypothetical protein